MDNTTRAALAAVLATSGCATDDGGPGPCNFDEVCLYTAPVDDAAGDLPAGRIAVAWITFGGEAEETLEIAYDAAWQPDVLTHIALDGLAPPSPVMFMTVDCTQAAVSLIPLSTDPDGSGSLTAFELLFGFEQGTVYGISQATVITARASCPPSDTFTDGLAAGTHVYLGHEGYEDSTFTLADGDAVQLDACVPGTPSCDVLDDPF